MWGVLQRIPVAISYTFKQLYYWKGQCPQEAELIIREEQLPQTNNITDDHVENKRTLKERCFPKFANEEKKKPIPKSEASVYHDVLQTQDHHCM